MSERIDIRNLEAWVVTILLVKPCAASYNFNDKKTCSLKNRRYMGPISFDNG